MRCCEPLLAMRGTEFGYIHALCRRRCCPLCQKVRANQKALEIAAYGEFRMARGYQLATVTLSQPKRLGEGCEEAKDRLFRAFARFCKKNRVIGRKVNAVCTGGIRCMEVTHKEKNERNPGFHAHLHTIMELRPGVSFGEFARVIHECWQLACPGANSRAQHIRPVLPEEKGAFFEVSKYPLKPLAVRSDKALREIALAFNNARLLQGWGEWRGAIGKGKELIEAEREYPKVPVRVAERGLNALLLDEAITIYRHRGRDSARETHAVQHFRTAIARDPRSFSQRQRDDDAGLEPPKVDRDRFEWWCGLQLRRARKRATGPPDSFDAPGQQTFGGQAEWA